MSDQCCSLNFTTVQLKLCNSFLNDHSVNHLVSSPPFLFPPSFHPSILLPSQDYLAHIIDQSDLSIHPEQVCALFGNIEDIYEFNRSENQKKTEVSDRSKNKNDYTSNVLTFSSLRLTHLL